MDPDKARVKPVWIHKTRTNHNFRHWRWAKEPQCLEIKILTINVYYNILTIPKSRSWKPGKLTKNT